MYSIVRTNGRPIEVTYAMLMRHPDLGSEMSTLDLRIGQDEVSIKFESWDEMIAFCEKHNFEYSDERSEAEQE